MNQEYTLLCICLILLVCLLYNKYYLKTRYNLYNGPYWGNPTDDNLSYRLGDLIYKFSLDYNYLQNVKYIFTYVVMIIINKLSKQLLEIKIQH